MHDMFENISEHLLSLIKDGCYYVYLFEENSLIITQISINNYTNMYLAKDIAIVNGTALMVTDWQITIATKSSTIELVKFYPNLNTINKDYGEYLI